MKTGCCNTGYTYHTGNQIICVNSNCKNYLGDTYLHVDKWTKSIAVSLIATCLICCSVDDFGMDNAVSASSVKEHTPLTFENLKNELAKQQILCQPQVFAQIKLESNNLQSFLVKRTNNMLGMRYPFKRETKACGIYIPDKDTIIYGSQKELKKYSNTNNYAAYNNWKDAVIDYKLWQENCFKLTDRYLAFLGNVYAEDSLYVKKIQKIAAKPIKY
jgi:hypothetical protein